MSKNKSVISVIEEEYLIKKIYFIRGRKVMLASDLAELYEVPTFRLNEQVKRNIERFPEYYMFQLTKEEFENLRSQIAISNSEKEQPGQWGGTRHLPYVFTEHGVTMLSSVLNSEKAIQVSIRIVDTFIKLREMIATHVDLKRKIEQMEKKFAQHDEKFKEVFKAINFLLSPPPSNKPKKEIGFHAVIKQRQNVE